MTSKYLETQFQILGDIPIAYLELFYLYVHIIDLRQ